MVEPVDQDYNNIAELDNGSWFQCLNVNAALASFHIIFSSLMSILSEVCFLKFSSGSQKGVLTHKLVSGTRQKVFTSDLLSRGMHREAYYLYNYHHSTPASLFSSSCTATFSVSLQLMVRDKMTSWRFVFFTPPAVSHLLSA